MKDEKNVSISVVINGEEPKSKIFDFDLSRDVYMKLDDFKEYVLDEKKKMKRDESINIIFNGENPLDTFKLEIPYHFPIDSLSDILYHLCKEVSNRKNIYNMANNCKSPNNDGMPYCQYGPSSYVYSPYIPNYMAQIQSKPYGFGFASPASTMGPPMQYSSYINQLQPRTENKNTDNALKGELLAKIEKLIDEYVEDMRSIDKLYEEEE